MKARKIVIFIFSVLAALAAVCAVFPEDGIAIGNIRFELPTLHEVFTVKDNTKAKTTEEILEERAKAVSINDDKEFKKFTETDPSRFHMPGNDISYFDELFDAMENSQNVPMRILHYGDSQLEGDRITADFRERLQHAFGGNGVGMVPAIQPVGAMTVVQTSSKKLPQYFSYNMGEHLSNGRYGVMSQVAKLDGSVTLSFRASSLEGVPHSKKFSKVTLVCSGNGSASINAGGQTIKMTEEQPSVEGLKFLTATTAQPVERVSLSASGSMELFAVMLDGKSGISVDNVPMRGGSGTVFTITARKTIEPFFKHSNVKLIILQYGGNTVPYMNREKSIQGYKSSLIAQVKLFKEIAPNAKILFIGPADMATNVKGEKQTYPQLEPTIKILKEVCAETGIAYWSLYDSMGGRNSMLQWVDANLAGKDYLHFTREGASKVADMLFDTFLMYYKFYCKRTGKTPKNFGGDPAEARNKKK